MGDLKYNLEFPLNFTHITKQFSILIFPTASKCHFFFVLSGKFFNKQLHYILIEMISNQTSILIILETLKLLRQVKVANITVC